MPPPTEAELQDLAARFASVAIPKAEWTHAAHLSEQARARWEEPDLRPLDLPDGS